LWKVYTKEDGNVFWNTELGKGRPGWHIECSVMSTKYLGKHFDIHTGGIDLVFPHHTNEIAQSEAANGCKFVNYWIHNEFLLVDGKKMSKSLGNFYTLRDILARYDATVIRYLLMSVHYRQQLNFTFEGLEAVKQAVEKLKDFVRNLKNAKDKNEPLVNKFVKEARKEFEEAMDDDLNVSEALSVIFKFIHDINKLTMSKKNAKEVLGLIKEFDKVLGLNLTETGERFSRDILELIKKRDKARKIKNWKEADKFREELLKKGVKVSDIGNKSIYTRT